MTFLLTSMARLKDWKALSQLNQNALLGQARDAGAIHYRIYRNVQDASRLLLLAEFPDATAARDFGEAIIEPMSNILEGLGVDDRMWEQTQLEGIG